MFSVVEACSAYLESQLDLDNCIDILQLAETYSLPGPRKAFFCFLGQNLDKLLRSEEFQRLTGDQLLHLLDSDCYPVDCSEATVLQAVLHWVGHDPAARGSFLMPLLKLINFETTEIWEVERVKRHRLLTNNTDALSVIVDAMWTRKNNHAVQIPGLVNPRGFQKTVVTVGGFKTDQGMTNDLAYYHHETKQWKQLTTITHVDQCNFGMAVLDNDIYVVGGCFNVSLEEQIHPFGFKYSVKTDSWASIELMEEERCRFCLIELHGKLYAIGGLQEQVSLVDQSSCEVYDPEKDTWTNIAPVPYSVVRHAGVALEADIYVSGGCGLHDEALDHLYAYNAQNNAWMRKTPMLSPRVDHCMVAYDNRVFVAGGWNDDPNTGNRVILDAVNCFDVLTNQWEVLTRMETPRYNMSAVVSSHMLMLIGGQKAGPNKTSKVIERYNLMTEEWEVTEEYPTGIWEHASCEVYVPKCREDKAVEVKPRSQGPGL